MAECPKGFDKTEESSEDIWPRLMSWYRYFSGPGAKWVFRGQGNCRWDLQPSLERQIIEFSTEQKADCGGCCEGQVLTRIAEYSKILGVGLSYTSRTVHDIRITAYSIERGLLREFQRRYYHYLSDPPAENSILEWLALMRHYGAPTRLLDWTYSFFVALFNAIEGSNGLCAIFALDSRAMDDTLKSQDPLRWAYYHGHPYMEDGAFAKLLGPNSLPSAYAVNPFRLNQRLTAQKGLFLAPARLDLSFEKNLSALFRGQSHFSECTATPPNRNECSSDGDLARSGKEDEKKQSWFKIAICTTVRQRNQILRHLQNMNINKATLYGDLVGFAESLRTRLAFPDILVSDDYPDL